LTLPGFFVNIAPQQLFTEEARNENIQQIVLPERFQPIHDGLLYVHVYQARADAHPAGTGFPRLLTQPG
jgi:hypothetical protein